MNKEVLKVGALVPEIRLGNPLFNAEKIIEKVIEAKNNGVELLVTPELCITGATCGDMFFQDILNEKVEEAVLKICEETKEFDITLVIGSPIRVNNKLYNSSLVINKGEVIGIVPKKALSWQESKWFDTGRHLFETEFLFLGKTFTFDRNVFEVPNHKGANFAITLSAKKIEYVNPENKTVYALLNMTSDYDVVSKTYKVKNEATKLSKENGVAYVYLMPGLNESTTDFVYSGYSIIIDDGEVKCEGEKFSFNSSLIYSDIKLNEEINDYVMTKEEVIDKKTKKEKDKFPFVPDDINLIDERAKEVLEMQASALARRLKQIGHYKMVLGLSGGSDSTLALIVCSLACEKLGIDNSNIITITMPGFGTTGRTYNNSINLAKEYNTTLKEISIKDACIQHFKDIGLKDDDRSVAFENAQARERTQILMDIANMENAFVVGTGDMSELALGWCTFNGDHMSMYAVNCNIPKTLIKHIIRYEAKRKNSKTLFDIIETPISPELLPGDAEGNILQKTESDIGPYVLHDYFLYHMIKYHSTPNYILKIATEAFKDDYSKEEITKWLSIFMKRFVTQQFKRNCVPDGPKVGIIGLSPRGDLAMPSDLDGTIWKL